MSKRLVILGGPCCVGKGRLIRAIDNAVNKGRLKLDYLSLAPIVIKSRKLRKGEVDGVDYIYMPKEEILALNSNRYITIDTGYSYQSIDTEQIKVMFRKTNLIMGELNPESTIKLLELLKKKKNIDFEIRTVAILPFSQWELRKVSEWLDLGRDDILYHTIKKKLEIRASEEKEGIDVRAVAALKETALVKDYIDKIVLHVGNSRPNSDYSVFEDEFECALQQLIAILRGLKPRVKYRALLFKGHISTPIMRMPWCNERTEAEIIGEKYRLKHYPHCNICIKWKVVT